MSSFARATVDDVRWEVRADLRASLLGADGLRLNEWVKQGRARIVKDGPHRTVYRIDLPEAPLYLKLYKSRDAQTLISNLFRSSKARREWRVAQQVARRGIATIAPVAVGERRRAGLVIDSFLVTEAIAPARSLDDYLRTVFSNLPARLQGRVRRQLARQLAELTASLHEAGVRHTDYHAGNLLVETEGDVPVRLRVLDLHAARVRRPLGWRAARQSLVQLTVSIFRRATRSDRARFLWWYAALRPGVVRDRAAAARELERLARQAREKHWRGRQRRCIGSNRHFFFRRVAGAIGRASRRVPEKVLDALIRNPDGPFTDASALLLKDSPETRVARIELPALEGLSCCVLKRFAPKGWWHDLWRRSPARRAWKAAHALLLRGIQTPEPLAMIERRGTGFTRGSYLLTRWVSGGTTLQQYAHGVLPTLPARQQRKCVRLLCQRLAIFLRRLHELGFDHRDLKAPNFIVTTYESSASGGAADPSPVRSSHRERSSALACDSAFPPHIVERIYLLDLDGLKRRRRLALARRVQNLARLHVSFHDFPMATRADKLRFLKHYLPGGLHGGHDWKQLWRQIEAQTLRKIQRNRERGRVIA